MSKPYFSFFDVQTVLKQLDGDSVFSQLPKEALQSHLPNLVCKPEEPEYVTKVWILRTFVPQAVLEQTGPNHFTLDNPAYSDFFQIIEVNDRNLTLVKKDKNSRLFENWIQLSLTVAEESTKPLLEVKNGNFGIYLWLVYSDKKELDFQDSIQNLQSEISCR